MEFSEFFGEIPMLRCACNGMVSNAINVKGEGGGFAAPLPLFPLGSLAPFRRPQGWRNLHRLTPKESRGYESHGRRLRS